MTDVDVREAGDGIEVAVVTQVLPVVCTANAGPRGLRGPAGADGTYIAVGPTPPENPEVGALWVDTS